MLSLLSLLFATAVAVAEYLGLFGDLGLVLSVVGIGLSVWFGLTASTQRTSDVQVGLREIATILRERLPPT